MGKFIDLTGKRFGRLVVVSLNEKRGKKYEFYWTCKCDCGNTKIIDGNTLKKGDTLSCKCLNNENAFNLRFNPKNRENRMWKRLFCHAINKHSKRDSRKNLIHTITLDEFKELSLKSCIYCGKPHDRIILDKNIKKKYLSDITLKINGLDRKDSLLGYSKNNCVSCCGDCNYMKRNMSVEQFKKHITKIYNHCKSINLDNLLNTSNIKVE